VKKQIGDKIIQIITKEKEIYGLSESGTMYRWEFNYDFDTKQLINRWVHMVDSPKYSTYREEIIAELIEKAANEISEGK